MSKRITFRTLRPSGSVGRWLPTFLGFPAGGLVAELVVGPVDSSVPALVGGAISGLAIGIAQALRLRHVGIDPVRWVALTVGGFAIGLGIGAATVGYRFDTTSLAVQGALSGGVVGLAQAMILRRHLGRLTWAWPPSLAALWALGWTITASAGIDVEARYTVFGSSGAVVVTALTAVLPVLLERRRQSGNEMPRSAAFLAASSGNTFLMMNGSAVSE